jgi:hypothetical protein
MNTIDTIFATRTTYRIGSPSYEALMDEWGRDAFREELAIEHEEWAERDDNNATTK